MPRSQRPSSSRSGAASRKAAGTSSGKSGTAAKPRRFGSATSRPESRTSSRFNDTSRKRSTSESSAKSSSTSSKRFGSSSTGVSRQKSEYRTADETKRPFTGTSRKPSAKSYTEKTYSEQKSSDRKFGEKKFGDRKFEDKKFGDKKFGDKKFGERKFGDRKFEDKKFGDKKFGDKKFGDRKFEGKKFGEKKFEERKFSDNRPFSAKPVNKRSTEYSGKGKSRSETKEVIAQPLRKSSAIIRLNKFLADSGICSRRQADELIEQGVVKVNGVVITEHGTRVHLSDLVTVRGEPVNAEKHLTYIVLNKPKDYITTTSDEKGRKTVMDLIPIHSRVYPIGRLDRNTTGVLLFTNDGEIAHRLMHPSYRVSRIYMAYLDKRLSAADGKRIATGVEITGDDDESYISGECNVLIDPNDPRSVLLELAEGKNREVRRIFETLGYEVEKLDRREYATITTRGLERGEYRHLTLMEIRTLEKLVGLETRYERETTAAKPRTKERTAERPQKRTQERTQQASVRKSTRPQSEKPQKSVKPSGKGSSKAMSKTTSTTKPRISKRPSVKKLLEG